MGNVVFSQRIGQSARASAKTLIPSASVLDHAVSVAQRNVKATGFKANSANTKEIAELYNAVIKDGRFIAELATDPKKVADKLHKPLSQASIDELKKAAQAGGFHLGRGGEVAGSVTVVCIAIVVVLCADVGPEGREVIIDRSGMLKF